MEDEKKELSIVRPKPLSRSEKTKQLLRQMEEEILVDNLRILAASRAGADYDDEDDHRQVTPEEIQKHGSIKAAIRHKRIAMDSRRPKSMAPTYLLHAEAVVKGIMTVQEKRLAREAGVTNNIQGNSIVVHVHGEADKAPQASYAVIDVEVSDDE